LGAVRDDDPGLPIKLGPCSNGEYAPIAPGAVAREAARRARVAADDHARRLGMSRREFLLSSMGAATTLLALAACSAESGDGERGGTFSVPPDAATDPDVATSVLDEGSPIIDVQTHLLEWPDGARAGRFGAAFPQGRCGDGADCFDTAHWITEVFGRSDTTLAVLSAVPVLADPDPLSAEVMKRAADEVRAVCGSEGARVLIQGQAFPNVGDLDAALDEMADVAHRFDLAAWKTYTHVGRDYRLDDDVGRALLGQIRALGPAAPKTLCVHKGFGADPADVGPAVRDNPDIAFCIYHSGYEGGVREGPFDPDDPNRGSDRLLVSLRDAGVGPGANVYAELGSTWRSVMGDPDQAAHLLGKLLVAFGEDHVLWGTDSIWYGSPQDQIRAMRTFEISDELQDRYGYPALTAEVKEKIFWRNAAALYGVDPATVVCDTEPAEREEARRASPYGNATFGPRTARAAREVFAAGHPWLTPG
jgi:predicted TIM-barrel fold metal-dependent hydrolase